MESESVLKSGEVHTIIYRIIIDDNLDAMHSPTADHELVDGSGTSRRWRLAVT